MRLFFSSSLLPVLLLAAVACDRSAGGSAAQEPAARAADSVKRADSLRADSIRIDSLRADSARADSVRADSLRVDSLRVDSLRGPVRRDTLRRGADTLPDSELTRGKGALRRKFIARLKASELAGWPVKGPAPRPGSLLPGHRIVAYYGNPLSKRMGILGALPPDEMLKKLERTAELWQKADSTTKVLPALHLIATVAQGSPGPGEKYRLRMTDSLIERVAGWAESRGWIMFVDVQIGHSTVADELLRLTPFLQRPYVHLALDPEFAMKNGGVPGKRIGTLDASDINHAIRLLADIVEKHKLPPKVLVVHRFTQRMLTNYRDIKLDPRVQVVIHMDGFGTPRLKEDAYRFFIIPEPVHFTGFKLFYKNDRSTRARSSGFVPSCPGSVYETVGCGDDGLMTPEMVLELYPEPVYIQYQ
jgi:hypothetical protein